MARPRLTRTLALKDATLKYNDNGWSVYDTNIPYKSVAQYRDTTYVVVDIDGVEHSIGTKSHSAYDIKRNETIYVAINGSAFYLSSTKK